MQEVFEKIIGKLEEKRKSNPSMMFEADCWRKGVNDAIEIVKQAAEQYNNGWIPCSVELPPQPKENPVFDSKPLELYLVDCGEEYSFRAFWNGKDFTDGWSKLNVIAWQPLPEPYKPKEECKS